MAEKQITYNAAYAKLEKIQSQIESDTLDVDALAEKLREAAALLKICRSKLFSADEETRKIIEELQ